MIHVAKISGGESSGVLMEVMEGKRRHDGWEVVYIYNETGQEAPETYEFLRNLSKHYGVKIVCLKPLISNVKKIGVTCKVISIGEIGHDKTIIGDLLESYGTPTWNARFCTSRMKSEPTSKYCNAVFGKRNYKIWLGIRADETSRIKELNDQMDMFLEEMKKRKAKPECEIGYLGQISDHTKQDVKDFWESMPFRLGIHSKPFLGNCLFCPQKDPSRVALAARYYPEKAEEFIAQCESSDVVEHNRKDKNGNHIPSEIMYRGYHSLRSVIETYSEFPTDELERQVTKGNKFKESGCATTCEGFGQLDMFS